MGLFDIVRQKLTGAPNSAPVMTRSWTEEGIVINFAHPLTEPTVDAMLSATEQSSGEETFLAAYLSQLVGEGLCELTCQGATVPWPAVYELIASPEHTGAIQSLDIPPLCGLQPVLHSRGTLNESDFSVYVDGWVKDQAEVRVKDVTGAIANLDGEALLLSPAAWSTADAIRRFNVRGQEYRTQHANELAWGHIRAHADAAGALYRTPYLETTFVLTPETLRMPLHKEETSFGRVLTVQPTFTGAPPGWLKAFDGFNSVQQHYDLVSKESGHVRVVISEPVRKILEVVKREMPGRRVAGARAERFVHNPWAFLGEAAHEVLKEEEFAADKAAAGAVAAVFSVTPRIEEGHIERIDLVVTEHFHGGTSSTRATPFKDFEDLERFITSLDLALRDERPQFPWNEYDLSVDGDSPVQLEHARQMLHLWRTQPASKISFEDIYELDGYSGRIEGIGVAKPIYVPLIQKPSTDGEGKPGWLPTDLTPMVKVTLTGHDGHVVIPLSKEWVDGFEQQVKQAESIGAKEVRNDSLPTALDTSQARTLVDSFRTMLGAPDKVKPDGLGKSKPERRPRETLLVKLNFFGIDYEEQRRLNLSVPSDAGAVLPHSLRPSVALKKHQLYGIAWFQHLVSRAPMDCRGALLADDMGLGKTLQLLTVLAWYYETYPNASPSVMLAPKSLVDNWAAEVKKFFNDSYPEVLVLYGDELQKRKQPLGLIDQQLRSRGVVELLKPGWAGTAKVVVTTYEVLTNYEFSMARQPFAFVICDEAQRIKTPGTRVTIAVKALKADFRVACTGTPVENTLADLWCLFDFVQPGLLGGLEDFGRTYRRPIECDTGDQKTAVARLQETIAPQTLRRTKQDIIDELPRKYFAHRPTHTEAVQFKDSLSPNERLVVRMSTHQNYLYLGGLKKLQDATKENDGRKRARLSFGALHLMKAVCAEPYCLPGTKFLPDKAGYEAHLLNSPKLAWLIDHLQAVREAGEKAIIFTELREVQAALYYFMREVFGLKPHIINGDSQNRQSYIQRFSDGQGFNVIILSTLAAGAGLNVTAANHVIHFTRAWNPAKENQATDRAYRIGQDKDVFVYCPVLVADEYVTFDVRLDELLRRKAGLADTTIGGSAMESMLNGTGRDVSFTELVGDPSGGVALPHKYLTMDDVDRLDGFRFEVLCKVMWSKAGYIAQVTNKVGGDAGVDVIAFKGQQGELLQCKSSSGSILGWDAIKEVNTGAAKYQAQFPGTKFRKLAVTNQGFNSGARTHAEANKVSLVERAGFEEMLARHPIDNYEFEDEVFDYVPPLAAA